MPATLHRHIVRCFIGLLATSPMLSHAELGYLPENVKQQLVKLDATGARLNIDAVEWACVKDEGTGLFWQKRDPSKALHNHASYTWYQPENYNPGTQRAYPATSPLNVSCHGYKHSDPASYCNTSAYSRRVNQENYCGYSDWRLPSSKELTSLASSKNSTYLTAINLEFFPFYDRFVYWTSSVDDNDNVQTIAQETRVLANAKRSDQLLVRLVRGSQY